jgi:hypothetical protein
MQESSTNAFVPELDERICILIASTSASNRIGLQNSKIPPQQNSRESELIASFG